MGRMSRVIVHKGYANGLVSVFGGGAHVLNERVTAIS
jgi:hypothetical protein